MGKVSRSVDPFTHPAPVALGQGLQMLNILGGTAGNWGRRPVDLDEREIMVLACKAPDLSK